MRCGARGASGVDHFLEAVGMEKVTAGKDIIALIVFDSVMAKSTGINLFRFVDHEFTPLEGFLQSSLSVKKRYTSHAPPTGILLVAGLMKKRMRLR